MFWLPPEVERYLRERAAKEPAGTPVFDAPAPGEDPADAKPVRTNPLPMLNYVDSADTAPPMPTSLDPNAPRKVPGMGGTKQSPDDLHKARVYRQDAEKLLTSKELDTRGDQAMRALDILNDIPADQRGQVIDNLDDEAFKNLLSRVPPDERERLGSLVSASKNPERKLKMWKQAHLSKARNAVFDRKQDIGEEDMQVEYDRNKLYSTKSKKKQEKEDDQWEKKNWKKLDNTDDEGNPLPDKKRTPEQQKNLRAHRFDVKRATHTKAELDFEVGNMLKDEDLTLAEVEALIGRKEKEYALETKHELDLSTQIYDGQYADHSTQWSEKDLDTIEHTLNLLPEDHRHGRARLAELWRSGGTDVNGRYNDDEKRIEIANPTLSQADVARKKVGEKYVNTNDPTVRRLELTLTHELGHAYAASHRDKFDKFVNAAGWKHMTKDELAKDGVSESEFDYLETHRLDPNSAHASVDGKRKTYSPHGDGATEGEKPYWGVDKTAIPDGSTWSYARVNPEEHFAESYEMAVHDPKEFHRSHVSGPQDEARLAKLAADETKRKLAAIPDTAANKDRRAKLASELKRNEEREVSANRSVQQLGDQYKVMRNDVFGTNTAAAQAAGRLQLANVSADRLKEFRARAEELSTPEQIRTLEAQFR